MYVGSVWELYVLTLLWALAVIRKNKTWKTSAELILTKYSFAKKERKFVEEALMSQCVVQYILFK